MTSSSTIAHSVTGLLKVPAQAAFAFMTDPIALGRWSLGCMDVEAAGPEGLYRGRSLFDGGEAHFRIDADPARGVIDYLLGTPDRLRPRISARIVSADCCDLPPGQCYLTLTAWRVAGMDDARWQRLCASHEAEILLIAAQCEAAAARS